MTLQVPFVRCLLVFGCIALLVIATPCYCATATEQLQSGYAAADTGDLAGAKDHFGQCVTQYPGTLQAAEASWKLGFIAIKEGDLAGAEQRFAWVKDIHPASPKAPDALRRLAYLARKAGRPESVSLFQEVVLRYPDSREAQDARYRLARLQTRALDFESAVSNFQGVEANSKASVDLKAEAMALEGMAYLQKWYKTGDMAQLRLAMETLEGVQQRFPMGTKGVAWSRFRLATFYLHEGKNVDDPEYRNSPSKGRAILEDAINKLPFNYFTWWMKAQLAGSYAFEGRFLDVTAECESVLSEQPPDTWKEYMTYMLGDSEIRAGLTEQGIATFRRLTELYPKGDWGIIAENRMAALID